jgi:hypothetical protein
MTRLWCVQSATSQHREAQTTRRNGTKPTTKSTLTMVRRESPCLRCRYSVFADLDDVSQLDNGAQLSTGDGEMTDSDSDMSAKEEDVDEDPPETPYVPISEEEFGDVSETKFDRQRALRSYSAICRLLSKLFACRQGRKLRNWQRSTSL